MQRPWWIVLVLCASVLPARAHDLWLEAEAYHLERGEPEVLRLKVGTGFADAEERPWEVERTLRLSLVAPSKTVDLVPLIALRRPTPSAALRLDELGTHLFVLDRRPAMITLEPPKFEAYLAEEGHQAAIAERKRRQETGRVGRERYTRFLKALIQVGDGPTDGATRTIGQRFEIVPLANPYALKTGEPLPVRIDFETKPDAGARVWAYVKGSAGVQRATAGENGMAELTLDRPGVWLVRTTHMRRCASDCGSADWESFWASLTFAVGEKP